MPSRRSLPRLSIQPPDLFHTFARAKIGAKIRDQLIGFWEASDRVRFWRLAWIPKSVV